MRKLWRKGAIEAVLEVLGEVRAESWLASGVRAPEEAEGHGEVLEGEEGGPGPP